MTTKRDPPGCEHCREWRSTAFDGLGYIAWNAKADRWDELGRRQRFCEHCRRWWWVKRGQEEEGDK